MDFCRERPFFRPFFAKRFFLFSFLRAKRPTKKISSKNFYLFFKKLRKTLDRGKYFIIIGYAHFERAMRCSAAW